MEISKQGLSNIKKHEGWRNCPYMDSVGVPTIGYGNTWYMDGTKVKLGDPCITLKEGEQLLLKVLERFETGVNDLLLEDVPQALYDSLVSLAHNIGLGAFEDSTLLKKVNEDKQDLNLAYMDAIAFQFTRWNRAGGNVSKGLKKRRNQEIYHFHPDYFNNGGKKE